RLCRRPGDAAEPVPLHGGAHAETHPVHRLSHHPVGADLLPPRGRSCLGGLDLQHLHVVRVRASPAPELIKVEHVAPIDARIQLPRRRSYRSTRHVRWTLWRPRGSRVPIDRRVGGIHNMLIHSTTSKCIGSGSANRPPQPMPWRAASSPSLRIAAPPWELSGYRSGSK